MGKTKKIIIFSSIGAIVVAIGLITLISFLNYQNYRKQFKTPSSQEIVEVIR